LEGTSGENPPHRNSNKASLVSVSVRIPRELKKRVDLDRIRSDKKLQDWVEEAILEKLQRESSPGSVDS
jgi:hypothetical protein